MKGVLGSGTLTLASFAAGVALAGPATTPKLLAHNPAQSVKGSPTQKIPAVSSPTTPTPKKSRPAEHRPIPFRLPSLIPVDQLFTYLGYLALVYSLYQIFFFELTVTPGSPIVPSRTFTTPLILKNESWFWFWGVRITYHLEHAEFRNGIRHFHSQVVFDYRCPRLHSKQQDHFVFDPQFPFDGVIKRARLKVTLRYWTIWPKAKERHVYYTIITNAENVTFWLPVANGRGFVPPEDEPVTSVLPALPGVDGEGI